MYAQAQSHRYMGKNDKQMLKHVTRGEGKCNSNNDCTYGVCIKGACECQDGYTGPTCKVRLYDV